MMTDVYIDENDGSEGVGWGNQYNQKKKGKWSLKAKILLGVVIIFAILLALNFSPEVFSSTVGSEIPTLIMGFKIELRAESDGGDGNTVVPGSNMVMFPYSVLIHVNDTTCDTVFGSLINDVNTYVEVIYIDPSDNYYAWVSSGVNPYTDLDNIEPYKTYYVTVTEDCVLDLSSWGTILPL